MATENKKTELHLNGRPFDYESLRKMFVALTGREPTPEEAADAKRILAQPAQATESAADGGTMHP